MSETTLGGRLRDALARYSSWRESVGYATDTYRYMLGPFVDYVDGEWPGDGPLTPDVVDGWLAHHRYPSANTQASFVACLRGLCRFLRFEGSEDFVPDERCLPIGAAMQCALVLDRMGMLDA